MENSNWVNMCLTSTETVRLIRDGEKGGGGGKGYGGGGRGRLYTYRHTVTRMIPALRMMGSDESHFNVSVGSDSCIKNDGQRWEPFSVMFQ